jgi:hypothetical protein
MMPDGCWLSSGDHSLVGLYRAMFKQAWSRLWTKLNRKGYETSGLGETPEGAKKDASEWLEDGIEEAERVEMAEQDGGVSGKLYISKCTRRLAAALRGDIGDLYFDWNEDGVLDTVDGADVEE